MRFDYFKQLPSRFRCDCHLVAYVDPVTGECQKGFETEGQAIAEDNTRARLMGKILPGGGPGWLSNHHKYAVWRERQRFSHLPPVVAPTDAVRSLKEKLETGCHTGRPPQSLATALGMRYLRRSVIGSILEGLECYPDAELVTFTALNANWIYSPRELLGISAATIKNQFATHLRRIGVNEIPGPFIAFLHGEFEPTSGKFVLHFHGVTTAEKYRVLLSMAEPEKDPERDWGYVPTSTGAAPIRCEQVTDRVRQFSYLLKAFWPQKAVRRIDGVLKRDRVGKRIHEPYASIALIWLDRQAPADIAALQGCRFLPNGQLSVAEADLVVGEAGK
jgi:hypothetical protein